MKTPVVEQKPTCRRLKWYWWVVIIVVSMMFGAGMKQDKVVTKEVPVTKTITQECDDSTWRALKSKDDEIINLAGKSFGVVSEAFDAIANLDIDTMERKVTELEGLSVKMQKLGPERQEILRRLGY